MDEKNLWEKTALFHGHKCGGLAIGFKAALYAMELLDIKEASPDEEIVCIAENDSCSVDAIQTVLGCTAGKGNLFIRMRGKQAYTFFNRQNSKSVRITLKELPTLEKGKKEEYMMSHDAHELFDVTDVKTDIPAKAKIYKSRKCDLCGETTAEPWLKLREDKIICLDCMENL